MNYFAKNIYFLRKQRGINQVEIPNFIGFSGSTWSNYENRRSQPNIDELIEISQFFLISLDDLILKDLSADAHLIEKSADKKITSDAHLIAHPIAHLISENEGNLIMNDSGGEQQIMTFADVVREVLKLRHDVDAMRAEKGKKRI